MRNYIIADNQELTGYALQNLLKRDEASAIFRAVDKAGLIQLLKEHEDAVVFLDYTLFDFVDEDQLMIVAERFRYWWGCSSTAPSRSAAFPTS